MEILLDTAWTEALAAAAAARRVLVLGPTDSGKSSFIRALVSRRPEFLLLDLDPGQKMLGAPGTLSLGRLLPSPLVCRFAFYGSAAVAGFRTLADDAALLAASAGKRPLVVNTAGYVRGPGIRLQAMTVAALKPDLVVAIAPPPALAPVSAGVRTIVLDRSPHASRKSEAKRRRLRQSAFAQALEGAVRLAPQASARVDPLPDGYDEGEARFVCAMADADGAEMEIAILEQGDPLLLFGRPPPRPVRHVRWGDMTAIRDGSEWRLSEWLPRSTETAG